MLRPFLVLPLLLLAPLAQAQTGAQPEPQPITVKSAETQTPPPPAAPEVPPASRLQLALKAHVQFLASDVLRGREAGTQDFNVAAEYVASQMLAAGLKPAGDGKGGWFQPVSLTSFRPGEHGSLVLKQGKVPITLAFGTDFVNMPIPAKPDFSVSGEVVFAGYGIVYPEGKRDDYKGLDVKGKVVAILTGVPEGLPTEVGAHLGDDDNKALIAQQHGAKAVVVIETTDRASSISFTDFAAYYDYSRRGWAGPDGVAHMVAPEAPVVAFVSQVGAAKLFAGARLKWAAVLAAEKKGARIPTGPLAVTLDATAKTRVRTSPSRNVVGLLEGSDPALKGQYVILSAHLDHVGIGDPVNGDRIYNGAMDNAIGNAVILEIAKRYQAEGKRPRRSILFLSLTAEEEGLIGSDYFAHNPVVPKAALVADLNIDMPILTYKLEDLVVDGEERMSLGPVIHAAAAKYGLKVVPDPTPEEMFFVRSDHYSFVQSGIPAVSIDTGPGTGEGAIASKKFLDENYHKPSDQIDLPWNWPSAEKYFNVAFSAASTLADDDKRPSFNKGDFFGVLFGGYGAQ
ncbi:M28 family peptidase [Sphingomonas sp.]|uniref:M28 family peptidase n=1 Tax=Sphingomonas sp. TaxID=28214 RepID=UPI001B0029A5|nr:M28 family peptidase [Sphingomonas sp.]MBO9713025.1 M28 family peptidase [Sphingomonas sp.]